MLFTYFISDAPELSFLYRITSPLFISYECLKLVESDTKPFYTTQINVILLKNFVKLIKISEKFQLNPFTNISTRNPENIPAKVDFGVSLESFSEIFCFLEP